MDKRSRRLVRGTFFALAIGYIAGVLTAPKSGKETRQDIKDTATRNIGEAEKILKKKHTELSQLINDVSKRADSLKGRAKKEAASVVASSKSAKEKAREVLSAMHEDEVKDQDLQKALQDAEKAIEHLKRYAKK